MRLLEIPNELKSFVNFNECYVQKCTDGVYAIVDHSIQTTIAVGDYDELTEYLRYNKG